MASSDLATATMPDKPISTQWFQDSRVYIKLHTCTKPPGCGIDTKDSSRQVNLEWRYDLKQGKEKPRALKEEKKRLESQEISWYPSAYFRANVGETKEKHALSQTQERGDSLEPFKGSF